MKEGFCLNIYMNLKQKHGKILLYEWLLNWAKQQHAFSATVYKAIAGYQKEGKIQEWQSLYQA